VTNPSGNAAIVASRCKFARTEESGKASTGIAVFTALLWVHDLLPPFEDLANPLKDKEGLARAAAKENVRARKIGSLDNDF